MTGRAKNLKRLTPLITEIEWLGWKHLISKIKIKNKKMYLFQRSDSSLPTSKGNENWLKISGIWDIMGKDFRISGFQTEWSKILRETNFGLSYSDALKIWGVVRVCQRIEFYGLYCKIFHLIWKPHPIIFQKHSSQFTTK